MSMQQVTTTADGGVRTGSLREALEIRRTQGRRFSLKEAIGVVVPLTTQLAALHAEGRTFFVYPTAIDHGRAGSELDPDRGVQAPQHERDRACMAPETRRGRKGDARASVFSVGAILYELLTGETVGPGMRRPSEAVPGLPANAEVVLGKALVADPAHRPADLAALAQALHQLCPAGSMPPPEADVNLLDHDDGFEVDVSLSMIPPPSVGVRSVRLPSPGGVPSFAGLNGPESIRVDLGPASAAMPMARSNPAPSNGAHSSSIPTPRASAPRMVGDGPFAVVEAAPAYAAPNPLDPTVRLASLKASVEDDPRPRYIVIKDGMDHGPFSGVELLQQIASHSFLGEHRVRDTISEEERVIDEWPHFAPFAEQAKLNQDIKQERKAFEAVVAKETTTMRFQFVIAAAVLGVLGAAGLGFWLKERSSSKNTETVQGDKASAIDSAGGLGSGKDDKPGTPGGTGKWSGGTGSFPQVAGGLSCEGAQAAYVEDYTKQGVPADLGAADFGNVLNRGSYLNSCGVPSNMGVDICVAVQNGRAVGVSVRTTPSNPGISGCISGQVRALGFPAHPRMDIARTSFAAQ